eukprot:363443-Chlamydomonas_euryale.AAC.2
MLARSQHTAKPSSNNDLSAICNMFWVAHVLLVSYRGSPEDGRVSYGELYQIDHRQSADSD